MNKKLVSSLLIFVMAIFVGAVHADDSKACDFQNATVTDIHPNFRLCSTHVFNAGSDINFEDVGQRAVMDEIVAMKTTIITQEMKRQYDFLDTTVRRLRTQLEKATLVAKMEAAGAEGSGGGSSGGTSNDRSIVLAGANNCSAQTSTAAVRSCLQNNLQIIRNAFAANNITQARKQLGIDKENPLIKSALSSEQDCDKTDRASVQKCIDTFNIELMKLNDAAELQRMQYQTGRF